MFLKFILIKKVSSYFLAKSHFHNFTKMSSHLKRKTFIINSHYIPMIINPLTLVMMTTFHFVVFLTHFVMLFVFIKITLVGKEVVKKGHQIILGV